MSRECKRIEEEGYKKAIEKVQQSLQQSLLAHDEQYAAKVKKIEPQNTGKMEQMRLKYKDKC